MSRGGRGRSRRRDLSNSRAAWSVQPAGDSPAERVLAADAEDFLKRMGVTVQADAPNHVLLEVGSRNRAFAPWSPRTAWTFTRPTRSASGPAGFHLENQMREAGGPFLALGETSREPAWDVQIAPPTWGANYAVPDLSPEYVGDDTFRSLAHSGANGMFVYGDWVLYAKDTRFPEIEQPDADAHFKTLREASERAAKYGIRIYFVVVSPKLPGDHKLFQRLPRVRG